MSQSHMNADQHEPETRPRDTGVLPVRGVTKNRTASISICVHLCSSAVLILLCSGCAQLEPIRNFGRNVADHITGTTSINAAVQMENQQLPDERREGINALGARSFGRK